MAKMNDIQNARNDGMLIALSIVKDKGIEGLEEEIKFRGITGIHTHLSKASLQKAEADYKKQVILYWQAAVLYILKENYQFGKIKLKNFYNKFEDLCDSVMKDYLTLEDIVKHLNEEYGIDLVYKEE